MVRDTPAPEGDRGDRIRYQAEVRELNQGFDIRMRAEGTDYVPVAVKTNLRDGNNQEKPEGVERVWNVEDALLLTKGT